MEKLYKKNTSRNNPLFCIKKEKSKNLYFYHAHFVLPEKHVYAYRVIRNDKNTNLYVCLYIIVIQKESTKKGHFGARPNCHYQPVPADWGIRKQESGG